VHGVRAPHARTKASAWAVPYLSDETSRESRGVAKRRVRTSDAEDAPAIQLACATPHGHVASHGISVRARAAPLLS
jgi:hypothetical protein